MALSADKVLGRWRARRAVEPSRTVVERLYVVTAVLTGLAVLAKSGIVSSVVPVPHAAVVLVLLLITALPLFYRRFVRHADVLGPLVLAGVWITAVVVQPVLLRELHARGRGTDQGDCVSIGLDRVVSGEWPYDSSFMWSDNPMSCGPGWLVAHLPAVVIGYPATMALLLTLSAVVVGLIEGRRRATVFLTLVGLSPGFWLAYANGNDFATFGILVVALVTMTHSPRRWVRGLAVTLSILVSQFRVPFVVLPAVLAIDRSTPATTRRTVGYGALAGGASVAIFLGFYLYDPTRMVMDGPFHIFHKFSGMLGLGDSGLLYGALLVLVSVVLVSIAVRLPLALGVLAYCAAFLVPLSALSLVSSIVAAENPLQILEYWEGVSWLTSLVCIAAGILAGQVATTEYTPRHAQPRRDPHGRRTTVGQPSSGRYLPTAVTGSQAIAPSVSPGRSPG